MTVRGRLTAPAGEDPFEEADRVLAEMLKEQERKGADDGEA